LADKSSGLFCNLLRPDWNEIQSIIFPDIRVCLQRTLKGNASTSSSIFSSSSISDPSDHMIKRCDNNKSSLFLNDMKIVYQLILECGKLGNTHDLYQSFLISNSQTDNLEMKCRFRLIFDSLQYIGMIGHTNKRKEHFERFNMEDHVPFSAS
jgi:hypothetical protein